MDDTSSRRQIEIRIVADTVCPWCYLGLIRLRAALARRPGIDWRLVWHSFLLNPDLPPDGVAFDRFVATRFAGQNPALLFRSLIEIGTDEGVIFDFNRVPKMPRTLDSHRLRLWAGEAKATTVSLALYRAYFEDGRDIGDRTTLASVAGELGLDAEAAARYLDSDAGQIHVATENATAHREGINGVPSFVIDGRFLLSGAQSPEAFLPLLDLACSKN